MKSTKIAPFVPSGQPRPAVDKSEVVAFPSMEAPGITRRPKKNGPTVCYWQAPKAAKLAGYTPCFVRLAGSSAEMAERCRVLTAEAKAFTGGRDGDGRARYDGTFGSLIGIFRTDPDSPLRRVRWTTKKSWEYTLDCLMEAVGPKHLDRLKRQDFRRWHTDWIKPSTRSKGRPCVSTAAQRMQVVRMVIRFCVGEYEQCARLEQVLSVMKFERPVARKLFLTAKMVTDFCRVAHEMERPSMALEMALQFETALRPKDVYGEWTPNRTGQTNLRSLTTTREACWSRGLVWEDHIDRNLVLAKPTSKSGLKKTATADLKLCPMVMNELRYVPASCRTGPVIISESTGVPYQSADFQRVWRRIANKAGIPKGIWNMDARAGAITEASDSGADIEHLRKFATHAHISMTERYNRNDLSKSRSVSKARSAARNTDPAEVGPGQQQPWADLDHAG